jgi:hypothetical protein
MTSSLCCWPCDAVLGTDLTGLIRSADQSSKIAGELIELSTQNQTKGQSVVDFGQSIRDNLRKLKSDLKPQVFLTLIDLFDDGKTKEMIFTIKDMATILHQSAIKSKDLSTSIQNTVDCLPKELFE